MNKIFLKIIIFVWTSLSILNFTLPKSDFSESENRFLSKFPSFSIASLFNGSYTNALNDYNNDHFPKRDSWISLKSQLDFLLGKRENNDVFIGGNSLLKKIDSPNNSIVNKNLECLKSFVDRYKKTSYLMVVPSSTEILKDKLPPFAEGWDEHNFITKTYSKLSGYITPIDVYDTLYENRDKYIYYKTDHHWTSDGAFLAYEKAAKTMNLPIHDYNDFHVTTISNSFCGTLYSKSGYRNISPDTIKKYDIGNIESFTINNNGKDIKNYNSIYFHNFLNEKDKYSYFLGGNQPIATIKTNSPSNKKLLIFKDSYALSFVPLLLKDFSEITLIDLRYTDNNLKNNININEFNTILFLYSIDEFSHQSDLKKLLYFN